MKGLVAGYVLARAFSRGATPGGADSFDGEELEEADSGWVFEVVERQYDRILGDVDSLNNVLIGILAAVVALMVLAIDKEAELGRIVLAVLVVGALVCIGGWADHNFSWFGTLQEPLDVDAFLADVAERPMKRWWRRSTT